MLYINRHVNDLSSYIDNREGNFYAAAVEKMRNGVEESTTEREGNGSYGHATR
jgi:hypothetical protein